MKISKKLYLSILITSAVLIYFSINAFTKRKEIEMRVASYNFAIGTQTVGSKYKFTDESMLVETAR